MNNKYRTLYAALLFGLILYMPSSLLYSASQPRALFTFAGGISASQREVRCCGFRQGNSARALVEEKNATGGFLAGGRKLTEKMNKAQPSEYIRFSLPSKNKSSTKSVQALTLAVQRNDLHAIDELLWQEVTKQQSIELLLEVVLVRFNRNMKQTPEYMYLVEKGAKALIYQSVLQKKTPLLNSILISELALEIRPKAFFIEAIENLIQTNLWPSEHAFFHRIKQEIDKISGQDGLSAFDTFAICVQAEQVLISTKEQTLYLRRADLGLARSLIVDTKNQTFAILSKKYGDFQAEGAFKRVSSALFVQAQEMDAHVTQMARVVNKIKRDLSKREIAFEKKYGNVVAMVSYPGKSDPTCTKTSYIQDVFDHDFYTFTAYVSKEKRKTLPLDELVDVFLQIAKEIQLMHHKDDVHRDIKAKNILFRRQENGTITTKICDYGHAMHPDKKPSKSTRPRKHGTLRYCPPELLYNKSIALSQFELLKALDMYGLANIMYELLTVETTPWGSFTWRALKKTGKKAEEAKELALSLQKSSHTELLEKSKQMPSGIEKDLVHICAQLLDPNPKTRMKIDACVEALLSVKNDHELKEA